MNNAKFEMQDNKSSIEKNNETVRSKKGDIFDDNTIQFELIKSIGIHFKCIVY